MTGPWSRGGQVAVVAGAHGLPHLGAGLAAGAPCCAAAISLRVRGTLARALAAASASLRDRRGPALLLRGGLGRSARRDGGGLGLGTTEQGVASWCRRQGRIAPRAQPTAGAATLTSTHSLGPHEHVAAHQPDLPVQGEQGARQGRGPSRDARLQLPASARPPGEGTPRRRRRRHVAASASSCRSTSSTQQSDKLQGQAEQAHRGRPRGPRPRGADPQVRADHSRSPTSRPSRPSSRARRRSSPSPSSGCSAKVEAFRTRKETIKATYTAAEAQTKIDEAMSGIGEEMGDVGMAIQRAEDKTAQMQARAGAIDELIASGALDDASSLNRRRRHHPRARGDELAVRRRDRARPAQGRPARPRPSRPARTAARSCRPSPRRRPSPTEGRSSDRPDPRRGSVRPLRRRGRRRSTSSTPRSRRAVEAGDEAAFAHGARGAARRRTHGRGAARGRLARRRPT